MSDKKNHVLIPAAVTVGALALVGVAYVETLTTLIARRRSVILKKLAAHYGNETDPIRVKCNEASERLLATPTEAVSIHSRDGLVLRGHWYPAENPRRILIMAHGWHGSWHRDFGACTPFLHDAGCSLLFIEQRCHGESEGKLISYGLKERYDVVDWLDWVSEHHPGLPVYLSGLSMGAATVLMAAGLPIANRVRGIIADCGYTSPKEIISVTVEKTLGRATRPTVFAVDLNFRLKGKWRLTDYSTLDAMMQNTDIPVLLIHGDADDFVPCRMSLENYVACRAPRDMLIVHGAGHGFAYAVDPKAYEEKVSAFFKKYD